MMNRDREEFLASPVEFSTRNIAASTLAEEHPAVHFPKWILGVAQTAVVAAAFFALTGQASEYRIPIRTDPVGIQSEPAEASTSIRSSDLFSRPQNPAAIANMMLRLPRLRSVDHLLD